MGILIALSCWVDRVPPSQRCLLDLRRRPCDYCFVFGYTARDTTTTTAVDTFLCSSQGPHGKNLEMADKSPAQNQTRRLVVIEYQFTPRSLI